MVPPKESTISLIFERGNFAFHPPATPCQPLSYLNRSIICNFQPFWTLALERTEDRSKPQPHLNTYMEMTEIFRSTKDTNTDLNFSEWNISTENIFH